MTRRISYSVLPSGGIDLVGADSLCEDLLLSGLSALGVQVGGRTTSIPNPALAVFSTKGDTSLGELILEQDLERGEISIRSDSTALLAMMRKVLGASDLFDASGPDFRKQFGAAGQCATLATVLELLRASPGVPSTRIAAAAYGMALSAAQAVGETAHFEDTRFVLDQLSRAKAEIDIAGWHSGVPEVTSAILGAAQGFADKETVACAEWPTPAEVANVVVQIAGKYACAT